MFRVVLDLGGMVCKGFCLLSLSISQLSSGVANLNVVGLFEIVGWAASCHTTAQRFFGRRVRTGPIATHLELACAQTKAPLLKLWSYAYGR